MTVIELIKEGLMRHGYDGLFCPGVCACKIDKLAPCGELFDDCEAGHLLPCDGSCDMGKCDFHIGRGVTEEEDK